MAINLTRAWSAASLVPHAAKTVAAATPAKAPEPDLTALNNILTSIFGSGGGFSNQGGQPQSTDAQNLAAVGYAGNLAAKNAAMSAPSQLYQILFGKSVGDPNGLIGEVATQAPYLLQYGGVGGGILGDPNAWFPSRNRNQLTLQGQYDLTQSLLTQQGNAMAGTAMAAARSPTYAPNLSTPAAQPARSSGWVPNSMGGFF